MPYRLNLFVYLESIISNKSDIFTIFEIKVVQKAFGNKICLNSTLFFNKRKHLGVKQVEYWKIKPFPLV